MMVKGWGCNTQFFFMLTKLWPSFRKNGQNRSYYTNWHPSFSKMRNNKIVSMKCPGITFWKRKFRIFFSHTKLIEVFLKDN